MSGKIYFTFEVPSAGGGISDDFWEVRCERYIRAWEEASDILGSRNYEHRGVNCKIIADWSPMLRSFKRYRRVMRKLSAAREKRVSSDEFWRIAKGFQSRRTKIDIHTFTTAVDKDIPRAFEFGAVENFLHDVFLIMNLSAPGCCNFYLSRLNRKDQTPKRRGRFDSDISLSEFYFDLSDLEGRRGKWPSPCHVELLRVSNWIARNRSGFSQVPENRMEAILFALLHIAREGGSPTSIIWLFYALETLFCTRPGENRRMLIERASILIPCDSKQERILKSQFTKLYNARSSLVHGGLKISHPMQHEGLDDRTIKEFHKWADATDFGFRLLIVALQNTISNGWLSPEFRSKSEIGGDKF